MIGVLEDSFHQCNSKMFGTDENFTVVINPDKDCEIWREREVVADGHWKTLIYKWNFQKHVLSIKECEVGEDVTDAVNFLVLVAVPF